MAGAFAEMLLEGVASPELSAHGMTTEQERAACGVTQVCSSWQSLRVHRTYERIVQVEPLLCSDGGRTIEGC